VSKRVVALVTILRITVLKVEVSSQIGHKDLHCCFGKCLTKTDPLATIEASKGKWMPLFAIGSEEERAFFVKSLWEELVWPLPLFRIFVECVEDDSDFSCCVNFVLSKGATFFGEVHWCVCSGGVLEAQCLLHGQVEERKILNSLECDDFAHKIFLIQVCDRSIFRDHLFPYSGELFPDFSKSFWVLREVGQNSLCCKLGGLNTCQEEIQKFVDNEVVCEDFGRLKEDS